MGKLSVVQVQQCLGLPGNSGSAAVFQKDRPLFFQQKALMTLVELDVFCAAVHLVKLAAAKAVALLV